MSTKAIGIRELRNNLSRYIRDVRGGARILVLDRDTVVAEIHEPRTDYAHVEPNDAVLDLVRSGVLSLPSRKRVECRPSSVSLPPGTAGRLLDADRAESDGPLR